MYKWINLPLGGYHALLQIGIKSYTLEMNIFVYCSLFELYLVYFG